MKRMMIVALLWMLLGLPAAADETCTHETLGNRYERTEISCQMEGEYHHKRVSYVCESAVCLSCDAQIGEAVEYLWTYYEDHFYDDSGVCSSCSYMNLCGHEETEIISSFDGGCRIEDDQYHNISIGKDYFEVCLSCGAEWYADSDEWRETALEPHTGSDLCTLCGWTAEDHECSPEELESRIVYSATPVDTWTHEELIRRKSSWYCSGCWNLLSVEWQSGENVVESHSFTEFGYCEDCGYVNTCAHGETYEEQSFWMEHHYSPKDEIEHTFSAVVKTETHCTTCCQLLAWTETFSDECTESHAFESEADEVCNACGYQREIPPEALFSFSVSNGQATVTGYKGANSVVSIPEYLDGYAVTEIGSAAFWDCENLQSIRIPDSVVTIGDNAFAGSGISEITLGAGVTNLGILIFAGCNNLQTIWVSENNPAYVSVDGVLFTRDMCMLVAYPAGSTAASYTIANGVQTIKDGAFMTCSGLTQITIPDTQKTIEARAFSDCPNLSVVSLAEGLESIGSRAFGFCSSLEQIVIPSTVSSMGGGVFQGCDALQSIEFLGSAPACEGDIIDEVDEIKYVERIIVPQGMTEAYVLALGERLRPYITEKDEQEDEQPVSGADYGTTKEEVIQNIGYAQETYQYGDTGSVVLFIQDILSRIGLYQGMVSGNFGYMTKYAVMEFQKQHGLSADGVCGSKTMDLLIETYLAAIEPEYERLFEMPPDLREIDAQALAGTAAEMVVIAQGCERIGSRAFADCIELRKVVIPPSVTEIALDAFEGCGLVEVFGYAGSYAQTYAQEAGISFQLIE